MSTRDTNDLEEAWQILLQLVNERRDDWRRQVVATSGLPLSRVKALSRLLKRSLSLRELADAMICDAPTATVVVNDLVRRGMVTRVEDPEDRRSKIVALTPEGRRIAKRIKKAMEDVPAKLRGMPEADAAELLRIVRPYRHE